MIQAPRTTTASERQ